MVNVRAAANFETKRLVGAVFDHFVDFYSVAVAVAKLAKRAFFLNSNFGWVFLPTNL